MAKPSELAKLLTDSDWMALDSIIDEAKKTRGSLSQEKAVLLLIDDRVERGILDRPAEDRIKTYLLAEEEEEEEINPLDKIVDGLELSWLDMRTLENAAFWHHSNTVAGSQEEKRIERILRWCQDFNQSLHFNQVTLTPQEVENPERWTE